MAHFAELNLDNKVLRVIVVNNAEIIDENGNESEEKGIQFCHYLFNGRWVQTSYNAKFRGLFAGIGHIYNKELDQFLIDESFNE